MSFDLLNDDDLATCVHCGLCLDFCPTYRLLGHEADSPRGRIYQVRQVYEGKTSPDDPDFREHIYACLDCRACQTACHCWSFALRAAFTSDSVIVSVRLPTPGFRDASLESAGLEFVRGGSLAVPVLLSHREPGVQQESGMLD